MRSLAAASILQPDGQVVFWATNMPAGLGERLDKSRSAPYQRPYISINLLVVERILTWVTRDNRRRKQRLTVVDHSRHFTIDRHHSSSSAHARATEGSRVRESLFRSLTSAQEHAICYCEPR